MKTIFRQLYDNASSTYTYLLADAHTREAAIIDPVFELHRRDLALIKELGLNLKYALDTHCHADHVTGSWLMKKATGCKIVLSNKYNASEVDHPVDGGDSIVFGGIRLQVWATPGHTDGCLSYVTDDQKIAFTGDCLMIRGAGRTDFQQGDAKKMYHSIHDRLFTLPDECLVYPAHDYDGRSVSTIQEEKKFNTRIGGEASEQDFVGYMKNLGLPHPKKIAIALPANMRSGMPENGIYPVTAIWGPVEETYDGILQISVDWVESHMDSVTILDVREVDERAADIKSIYGALAIPIGELVSRLGEIPRSKPIVTVCHSGKRSAQATVILKKNGFDAVANLKGGMVEWMRADRGA
jgi:glyoxylase-like metal-dependent hydrolase (beta-lactamase superfamily II)/rhodanese-related sulfurtransferase